MTQALARAMDPTTSQDAAASITVTPLEAECLRVLRHAPQGLTSEEIAEQTQLSLVTVSPRLRPLANDGLVYAGGKRKNRSGHLAIVWVAVPQQSTLF
jgi:transcription initiation factor IIE alpha subunit